MNADYDLFQMTGIDRTEVLIQSASHTLGARIIRINPRDCQVPNPRDVGIPSGALAALTAIDAHLSRQMV